MPNPRGPRQRPTTRLAPREACRQAPLGVRRQLRPRVCLTFALALAALVVPGVRIPGPSNGRATAAPRITEISPRGLQVGGATRLIIRGEELDNGPVHLIVGHLAPVVGHLHKRSADRLELDVQLPPSIAPNIYPLRLATDKGVSNPVLVGVDALVQQTFDGSPPSVFPVALTGELSGQQVHRIPLTGAQGEPLVVDIEGRRIGSQLRPVLRLYAPDGQQVAWSHPRHSINGDARFATVLPETGTYHIELHDRLYEGPEPGFFRLKIGPLRFADRVFPVAVTWSGTVRPWYVFSNLQPSQAGLLPPSLFGQRVAYVPWPSDGHLYTGGQPFLLRAAPGYQELVEPENDAQDRPIGRVPLGISGRISERGDVDQFLVSVREGSKIRCEVFSHRLGTPLDTVLEVDSADGKQLAKNDDQPRTVDPAVDVDVPAGVTQIRLRVACLVPQGGPDAIYRLTITQRAATWQVHTPATEWNMAAGTRRILAAEIRSRGKRAIDWEMSPSLTPVVALERSSVLPEDEVALIPFRSAAVTQGVFPVRLLAAEPTADATAWRTVALTTGEFPGSSTQPPNVAEELVIGVHPLGDRPSLHIDWGQDGQRHLARGTKQRLPVRWDIGKSRSAVDLAAHKVRLSLITSQSPRTRKENNKQVPDPARMLRLDGPTTFRASAAEAHVTLVIPGDLPLHTWAMAVRGELLSTDGKEVLASNDGVLYRAETIEPLRIEAKIPSEATLKAGGDPLLLVGQIARHPSYRHAVALTVEGLPEGVSAPEFTVAATMSEFRLSLKAAADTKPQEKDGIRVVARFVDLPVSEQDSLVDARATVGPLKLTIVSE